MFSASIWWSKILGARCLRASSERKGEKAAALVWKELCQWCRPCRTLVLNSSKAGVACLALVLEVGFPRKLWDDFLQWRQMRELIAGDWSASHIFLTATYMVPNLLIQIIFAWGTCSYLLSFKLFFWPCSD